VDCAVGKPGGGGREIVLADFEVLVALLLAVLVVSVAVVEAFPPSVSSIDFFILSADAAAS
jgi:hypothetical protein